MTPISFTKILKKNFLYPGTILFSLFFLLSFAFVSCGTDNLTGSGSSEQTGSISLSLSPDASLGGQQGKSGKTISPADEDLAIAAYDISFNHNLYPYPEVALNDVSGTETSSGPVILKPGTWNVSVNAKNSSGAVIGLGISSFVINPGRHSSTAVTIRNIQGYSSANFSVNLSAMELVDPVVSGTLIEKDSGGVITGTTDLSFSLNNTKTNASFNGQVPAGFFELELVLKDIVSNSYAPVANYHNTICFYAGIPIEKEFILSQISNGGGSIIIEDEINRPIKIAISGIIDELVLSSGMIVSAIPLNTSVDMIDRFEWRLNNEILDGENTSSLTIYGRDLLPGTHQLEVIIWKDAVVSSEKVLFDLNTVPLAVSIDDFADEILEGTPVTVSTNASLEADSYEWYLNGSLLDGETGSSLVLNQSSALAPGSYTLEVRINKGIVTRSDTDTFTISPLTLETQFSTDSIIEGETATATATANFSVDSYSWSLNGNVLTEETGSSATIGDGLAAGEYTLTSSITNGSAARSSSAVITILPLTVELQAPVNSILKGGSITVTSVLNSGVDSYEWSLNNSPISGETGSSITLGNDLAAGEYSLSVSVTKNSVNKSGTFTFTVNPYHVELQAPATSILEGQTLTVTAAANVAVDNYRWYLDNSLIDGETGSSIEFGSGLETGEYTLAVTVTKDLVESSALFTVTINELVEISVSPAAIVEGQTFTATATTSIPVDSYEWFLNGTLINGETGSSIVYGSTLDTGIHSLSVTATVGTISGSNSINVNVIKESMEVSAETKHMLLLKSDGTVLAWGYNYYGQLGNGTTTNSSTPIPVSGLTDVIAVQTGSYHSLALKSDGTVWAWGYNYGQLGTGSSSLEKTPVQITSLSNIIHIEAGNNHSFAIQSDGTVWAWGDNNYGELGDGTTSTQHFPVRVTAITDIKMIYASSSFSIAIKSDGTVWAWGYNYYGQLGDGTRTNNSTPTQLTALSDITSVSVGQYHCIALKSDGTVWAWGYNSQGQLGTGITSSIEGVVQASTLSDITAIAAGYRDHSLAIKSDGTVWAWGSNSQGQLGNNGSTTLPTPTVIPTLSGVTKISAGEYLSAAIKSDGTAWVWGYNYYGQLGDGTTTLKRAPILVAY
ncbi:MAG: hypothetical protein GY754_28355 [bacterium]|nr:hypothetical protein [bacterium]